MTAQPAATHSLQLGDGIVVTFVADGSIHVPHHIFLGQDGSPELWTDHPEYLVGAPGSMAGRCPMGELN